MMIEARHRPPCSEMIGVGYKKPAMDERGDQDRIAIELALGPGCVGKLMLGFIPSVKMDERYPQLPCLFRYSKSGNFRDCSQKAIRLS